MGHGIMVCVYYVLHEKKSTISKPYIDCFQAFTSSGLASKMLLAKNVRCYDILFK